MKDILSLNKDDINYLNKYSEPDVIKISAQLKNLSISGSASSKIGKRKEMEDTELSIYTEECLTPYEITNALQFSINKLSEKAKNEGYKSGSCLNFLAVNSKKDLVCANMGDSVSVAFIWSFETKKVKPIQLNNIHSPNLFYENKIVTYTIFSGDKNSNYIKYKSGKFEGPKTDELIEANLNHLESEGKFPKVIYRLNGKLSVGCAINHNFKDIESHPEILYFDLDHFITNDNDRIFIASFCDGFFETQSQTLDNYSRIIEHAINNNNTAQICNLFSHFAEHGVPRIKLNSKDNLTALCVELPAERGGFTYFQGVFDGHGGAEVSKLLKDNLKTELEDCLNIFLYNSIYFDRYRSLNSSYRIETTSYFSKLCSSFIPTAITVAEVIFAGVVMYGTTKTLELSENEYTLERY